MPPAGSLIVVGSGPLIGSHTAQLFASKSFTHIALISRSQSKLDRDAAFVTSVASAAVIRTYTADVTVQSELNSALTQAIADVGLPEVVLYNAARIKFGNLGEYSHDDMVCDFKVPNLGLYTTASVLLPHLQALAKNNTAAHPALFITSGAIAHRPLAPAFSLSMAKAAQANFARLLAEENKGIVHVALVTIGGPVSPKEEINNPKNIAGKFWELYQQEKGQWELEMRCGW